MNDTYVPQTGGSHYEFSAKGNQHWDLMDRWDIEYLVATASKYVVRYDRKGTAKLDLEKSMSYIQKQLVCHPNKGCRRVIPIESMLDWYMNNEMTNKKKLLLELIHVDGSPGALRRALWIMQETIDAEHLS